jgi:hypothetical protein
MVVGIVPWPNGHPGADQADLHALTPEGRAPSLGALAAALLALVGCPASTGFFSALGWAGDLGAFLPGPFECSPYFLQLFTAEPGPHLGEPVLFFLLDVMGDTLHQHRGLGIEALGPGWHARQLHAQDVGNVMLFIGLQHDVLEVGEDQAGSAHLLRTADDLPGASRPGVPAGPSSRQPGYPATPGRRGAGTGALPGREPFAETAAITYTDGRTLPSGTQGAAPRSEAGSLHGALCTFEAAGTARILMAAAAPQLPVVWMAGPWTSCYQPGPKPRQADGDRLLGAPGR